MFKKTLLVILLFLTTGCGYEPIHSKKKMLDTNFSINKIDLIGDREINIKIKQKLNNYILNKKTKNYYLKVNSESTKTTVAKNTKGDPTVFNLDVKILVLVTTKDNSIMQMRFVEKFKYNNKKDKFEIKRYEKEIKINLTEAIMNDLIIRLSSSK
tara:strand:+ start:1003 stop:1467 length:465 start_codon:yes stop_codon:yes gene_type:complete